jgi:hypothetical protein
VVLGWIQQLEKDEGRIADRLHGFKGHALGAGPASDHEKSWSKKSSIDFTLRSLKEVDVKNRIEGEPLMLNVSFSF